jgi:hypothetical protein
MIISKELVFEWLCRKYVQRQDLRQLALNLQYTEAETHDLTDGFMKLIESYEPLTQAPIDMILHCPQCHVQHIDEPERSLGTGNSERLDWDNPPHRSHLCGNCGCIWRPADVPTNGVAAIKTKGKADTT